MPGNRQVARRITDAERSEVDDDADPAIMREQVPGVNIPVDPGERSIRCWELSQ